MKTLRTRGLEHDPNMAGMGGGMAGPAQMPRDGSTESVIGSELVIRGNVKSSGDVRVDGMIKGDVECAMLTVSENGVIEGNITAEHVVIHGKASGAIRGRTVMLHATAQVEADIMHQGIGIEMGTRYDGTLKWVEDSELRAA